jgi:hypothetical protein
LLCDRGVSKVEQECGHAVTGSGEERQINSHECSTYVSGCVPRAGGAWA